MKKPNTTTDHFIAIHNDYEWIIRNINSSSTPMQMEACDKLIALFKQRYKKDSNTLCEMLLSLWLKRKEEIREELQKIEQNYKEYAIKEEDATEDH